MSKYATWSIANFMVFTYATPRTQHRNVIGVLFMFILHTFFLIHDHHQYASSSPPQPSTLTLSFSELFLKFNFSRLIFSSLNTKILRLKQFNLIRFYVRTMSTTCLKIGDKLILLFFSRGCWWCQLSSITKKWRNLLWNFKGT